MSRGEPTKTIGHARAAGETALTMHCLGCYHQAVKTFEELKLWNDMIFVETPKHRRLVRIDFVDLAMPFCRSSLFIRTSLIEAFRV
jgi:hypothetical protein